MEGKAAEGEGNRRGHGTEVLPGTNCLDFQLLATLVLWELCPARAPTAFKPGNGRSDECRSRAVTSPVLEGGTRSHCSDDAV